MKKELRFPLIASMLSIALAFPSVSSHEPLGTREVGDVAGDGICTPEEQSAGLTLDCALPPAVNGDGICSPGETSPLDCR